MDREARSAAFARSVRLGLLDGGGHGLITAVNELGGELSLAFEIGCCRLLMRRIMAVDGLDGNSAKVAKALRALNRALTGATRLQWQLVAEGGSTASQALTAMLAELERE